MSVSHEAGGRCLWLCVLCNVRVMASMAALPWVMVTRNVTMSRRVTHIVPTRSDVTQIFGTNLAPN